MIIPDWGPDEEDEADVQQWEDDWDDSDLKDGECISLIASASSARTASLRCGGVPALRMTSTAKEKIVEQCRAVDPREHPMQNEESRWYSLTIAIRAPSSVPKT